MQNGAVLSWLPGLAQMALGSRDPVHLCSCSLEAYRVAPGFLRLRNWIQLQVAPHKEEEVKFPVVTIYDSG